MPSTSSYQFEGTTSVEGGTKKGGYSQRSTRSSGTSTASTESPISSPSSSPFFSSLPAPSVASFSTPGTRVHITGRLSPTKLRASAPAPSALPSSSISALHDIWAAYQQQRALVSSLSSELSAVRHASRVAHSAHERYQRDVYDSIARLKADFVTAQAAHERALEKYRKSDAEKDAELRAVKGAIQGYKARLADDADLAALNRERAPLEEKERQRAEDDSAGVVDFEAEVKVLRSASKGQGKGSRRGSTRVSGEADCRCSDCEVDEEI